MIKQLARLRALFLSAAGLFSACAAMPGVGAKVIPPATPLPAERAIAPGPFKPTWDSLIAQYQCPEWFRDAKLGIWSHWSAQCVPERGDWYARNMYIQGNRQYEDHVKRFGHPTEVGFMEMYPLWTAEKWDPEALMQLYVDAGAKYFVSMANHEDNFDAYNSKYHAWNSVNVGPHRDIIGAWEKIARKHGLKFGVSNHSSHAWHWFQTVYGYDAEGPLKDVRYDAFRLTKADGAGKWWDGLDPQDLYCPPIKVIPEGFTVPREARDWHAAANAWTEDAPTSTPLFTDAWFWRARDLVDQYDPDFVYLDNSGLPLGQAGLDFAAHYYNANAARRGGKPDAVLTTKGLRDERRFATVKDYERGVPRGIQELPYEEGTCIGQWHYDAEVEYKTYAHVLRILVDIVSKNGTLLVNIPMRGDGSIDEKEVAILKGMAAWIKINGEGIYGTRPWTQFGEGPTEVPPGRAGDKALPYTPEDFRFTTKDGFLYAFEMAPPTDAVAIHALGNGAANSKKIAAVSLVGSSETLHWKQEADALRIERPAALPCENIIAFKIGFEQ